MLPEAHHRNADTTLPPVQHGGANSKDPGGLREPAPCGTRGGGSEAQGCLRALEEAVGYSWRHPELLQEALTHCSWPHPAPRSYQRLEFLGDAVLELLVVAHLVTAFPCAPPLSLGAAWAMESVPFWYQCCVWRLHRYCSLRHPVIAASNRCVLPTCCSSCRRLVHAGHTDAGQVLLITSCSVSKPAMG
jgi:hypothetical protein